MQPERQQERRGQPWLKWVLLALAILAALVVVVVVVALVANAPGEGESVAALVHSAVRA